MAQQWEYKRLRNTSQNELDELGKQGWELAGATLESSTSNAIMIFKRPIEITKTHDSSGRDGR